MAEHLNKKELVAAIAEANEITKKEAGEALEMVTSAITSTLKDGGSVKITGFGKFSSKFVEAHERVSNFDGKTIKVPAKMKFKAKLSDTIAA